MAQKIKVIGYVRVSTLMQVMGKEFSSIEAQQAIIRDYVARHPEMELIEIFTDPGRSGKNMNRPGMQALLRRVKHGDIKFVLSYKLDRISRDKFDYYEFEKLMRSSGARVHYTNDINSDGSPAGELMKDIMAALAMFERSQTSQRIKDKFDESVKAGYRSGGYAPLGYVFGDLPKTIKIDQDTAHLVKEIFEHFVNDVTLSDIARIMTHKYGDLPPRKSRNGKVTQRGKYCENFIMKLLKNPTYAGYVYKTNPKLELYEGLHEGLIERTQWEEVQQKLRNRNKLRKIEIRECNPYILKKYLFCACGANMTVGGSGKRHKDGSPYHYYICSKKKHYKSECDCDTRISLSVMESVIFSIIGHYTTPDIKPAEIPKNEGEYKNELLAQKRKLTIEKSNLDRDLKNALKRFAGFDGNAALKRAMESELQNLSVKVEITENRLIEINEELALYEKNISLGDVQNKAILENLDSLQKQLIMDERREILKICIKKAVLQVKLKKYFKREFRLTIFPTTQNAANIPCPALEVSFSLDNSKGKGEWAILSPFELKCENFGKTNTSSNRGKIKRHWLHEVMRWGKQIDEGSTITEIAELNGLGKSMVSRKLKLLKTLSNEVIEAVLTIKYEKDIEAVSFRKLDNLSELSKPHQMAKLNSLIAK